MQLTGGRRRKMAKTRIWTVMLAAVFSIYVNTAIFSMTTYAAEAEEPVKTEEDVIIDDSVLQNSGMPEEDESEAEASFPETEENDLTEKTNAENDAEKTAEQQPESTEETTETAEQQPESAEEHHLAFASDYHNTEGSIENAMTGMPEDVEYVSLIGDMVGDRGGSHPEYDSREILDLVTEVFPELDNTAVSIVWATHDQSVNDEGTEIVKCMDGVSEPIREGTNKDGSPAYYIYGIGHYDMTKGDETSADAAAAFKQWVNGINHTIPVIVLCHVPIQASRGDNNGASYWNEALNYASTGVEGITTTETAADIIRNVLFLHGHNHTNDPSEYYFGAGTELSVQVDNSSVQSDEPQRPPHGRRAEGILSDIYYTSLTAGYLKTSGNATLVTVTDGALSLAKYKGGQNVSLGVNGTTNDLLGDSITIAARRHTEGEGIIGNVIMASCENGGSYDLAFCCTICGEELYHSHILTDAAGHHFGEWTVVKKATETEEGLENRICSACGKTESRPISMFSPAEHAKSASFVENENTKAPEQRTEGEGRETSVSPQTAASQKTSFSPQTGDCSTGNLWMTIMYMSLIFLVMTAAARGAAARFANLKNIKEREQTR